MTRRRRRRGVVGAVAALSIAVVGCGSGDEGSRKDGSHAAKGGSHAAEIREYFSAEPRGWAPDGKWWRPGGWGPGDVGLAIHHPNLGPEAASGAGGPPTVFVNILARGELLVHGRFFHRASVTGLHEKIDRLFAESRFAEESSQRRLLVIAARGAPWWALRVLTEWRGARPYEFVIRGLDAMGREAALGFRISAASREPMAARFAVATRGVTLPSGIGERRIHLEFGGRNWELPAGGYEVAQPRSLASLNAFAASFDEVVRRSPARSVELEMGVGGDDFMILHVVALLDILVGAGVRTVRISSPQSPSNAVDLTLME